MAADGIDSITLNLVHGQKRQNITVTLPEAEPGGVIMNRHLAAEVHKATGIIPRCQRLIYSGKTLQDPLKSLKEEGITPGCKIMLLSKPKCVVDDPVNMKLNDIDKNVDKVSVKISDVIYQIDAIIRGGAQPLRKNGPYIALERQLVTLTETLAVTLEQLDAMDMCNDIDNREHRKTIVNKINDLIAKADSVNDGVTEKIVCQERRGKQYAYI